MNHRNEITGKVNGHNQSKRKPEHRHGNTKRVVTKKTKLKNKPDILVGDS